MRMVKFSVVGAMGILVQLAMLAALTRLGVNYLLATVCGVEAAVLHNFCWHQRFTWRDRRSGAWLPRLLRFHLSNGLLSLIGNLALMRLLVGLGVDVMLANGLAIAACSLVNYLASDLWVFAQAPELQTSSFLGGRASTPGFVVQREHR